MLLLTNWPYEYTPLGGSHNKRQAACLDESNHYCIRHRGTGKPRSDDSLYRQLSCCTVLVVSKKGGDHQRLCREVSPEDITMHLSQANPSNKRGVAAPLSTKMEGQIRLYHNVFFNRSLSYCSGGGEVPLTPQALK